MTTGDRTTEQAHGRRSVHGQVAGSAPATAPALLAPRAPLTPPVRWRRVFPGEERQLAALRRWLESLLPDCPARDDVVTVASELGSNACLHTASGRGGWFAVEITCHQAVLRVAVADCGGPNEPHVIDDPAGERGRGLLVVRGMSVRTGVSGDHQGRLVWADLRWDAAGAAGLWLGADPAAGPPGVAAAGPLRRHQGLAPAG